MKHWVRMFLTTGLVTMMAMSAGCFHEDDETDTGPTGPVVSDFNEDIAVQMAEFYAESAADNIDQVLAIATSVPRAAAPPENAVWNATDMQWEWTESLVLGALTLEASIVLQYLDEAGDPQQAEAGATGMLYLFSATGTQDQGGAGTLTFEYTGDVDIDNLNGQGPLVMHGTGGNTVIIELSLGGLSTSNEYNATWATASAGIEIPTDGGCPEGMIIYTLDPYVMTIVFDGSDIYLYSMVDPAQTPIDLDPAIDGLQDIIEQGLDCGE